MNSRITSPGPLLTALTVVALLLAGCAATPARRTGGGASGVCLACVREAGVIGVIATSTIPKFSVTLPLNREQAAKVWRETLTYGEFIDADPAFDFRDALLVQATMGFGVVWIAAGGVAGQVIGATKGVSSERLREANDAIRRAIAGVSLQELIRTSVITRATGKCPDPIRLVSRSFPPGQEAEYAQMAGVMCGTLAWLPPGQSRAQYLAAQGLDAYLEVQLVHPRLAGRATVNPALAVVVEGGARLVSVRDGTELASIPLRYHGAARRFTAWAADDANMFRAELERCGEELAAQCVDSFFPPQLEASTHSGSCHRRTLATR